MTCLCPKTIFIRNSHPIDFQEWKEEEQHRYNKAKQTARKGYTAIQVPCGHCLGCKLDHANEWATRCTIEAKNWTHCCMITLTYNNKNLPKAANGKPTLCKKDVQDFIKRLRYHNQGFEEWTNPKTRKTEKPIRYFYCGEYGPKGGRPHYHMIIFNWEPKNLEYFSTNKHGDITYKSKELYNGNGKGLWGKGFCTVSEFHYNTACYVARYCTKKAGLNAKTRIISKKPLIDKNGKWHTQYYKNKSAPIDIYINMSTGCGIGLKYWLDNIDFLKKWRYIELKINDQIKQKPLPRYFKKKWNEQDWETYEQAKYEDFKKSQEIKKKLIKLDNLSDLYTDKEKWKIHLEKIGEKLHKHTSRAGILSRNATDATRQPPSIAQTKAEERNQDTPWTAQDNRWSAIFISWQEEEKNFKKPLDNEKKRFYE